MALRNLAREGLESNVSPPKGLDTAFAHLWPEPDEPELFRRYRTQGRRWSLLFGALLSGDISSADTFPRAWRRSSGCPGDGHLSGHGPWWSCGYTIVVALLMACGRGFIWKEGALVCLRH